MIVYAKAHGFGSQGDHGLEFHEARFVWRNSIQLIERQASAAPGADGRKVDLETERQTMALLKLWKMKPGS